MEKPSENKAQKGIETKDIKPGGFSPELAPVQDKGAGPNAEPAKEATE